MYWALGCRYGPGACTPSRCLLPVFPSLRPIPGTPVPDPHSREFPRPTPFCSGHAPCMALITTPLIAPPHPALTTPLIVYTAPLIKPRPLTTMTTPPVLKATPLALCPSNPGPAPLLCASPALPFLPLVGPQGRCPMCGRRGRKCCSGPEAALQPPVRPRRSRCPWNPRAPPAPPESPGSPGPARPRRHHVPHALRVRPVSARPRLRLSHGPAPAAARPAPGAPSGAFHTGIAPAALLGPAAGPGAARMGRRRGRRVGVGMG